MMKLLNLFPIPRRYERVPGALAFAAAVAMVIVWFNQRTPLALAGLIAAGAVLLAVYLVRFGQRREWNAFIQQENRRLLQMKGARGPAGYIAQQRAVAAKTRHPELKLTAQLNLSTGLLAGGENEEALELLAGMTPPEKMPNPTMRLAYWTQVLRAHLQMEDREGAEAAYEQAVAILPEVSDLLKISFIPSEIHYRLLRGEYELALKQLSEIPVQDLDEASQDMLQGYRIMGLRGLGIQERADKLERKLETHDLLPSTRLLLRQAACGLAGQETG